MSTPKRHHYIPRMLLKNFVDRDHNLHWSFTDDRRGLKKARVEGVFVERHLYSVIGRDGDRDPAIEAELSRIEGDAAKVLDTILTAARAGRPPDLSTQEKSVWYRFFLVQWRRTPELQQSVASDAVLGALFDSAIELVLTKFPERADEVKEFTPAERARMIHNIRTEIVLETKPNVEKLLEERGIMIMRIERDDKAFVIGSRPVVVFNGSESNGLHDPNSEMWLPVASDIAIGPGTGGVKLGFLAADSAIRTMNREITCQSSVIAGCSPDLIRSLTSTR